MSGLGLGWSGNCSRDVNGSSERLRCPIVKYTLCFPNCGSHSSCPRAPRQKSLGAACLLQVGKCCIRCHLIGLYAPLRRPQDRGLPELSPLINPMNSSFGSLSIPMRHSKATPVYRVRILIKNFARVSRASPEEPRCEPPRRPPLS